MILCPIALAVGCRKCPAFSFCPVKTLIGDQTKGEEARPEVPPADKPSQPRAKKARGRQKGR
jgi:hypothetical protein